MCAVESADVTTGEALSIGEAERAVVMEELTAFTASLPAIEMRAPYEQLSAQVDEGEVPGRLVPALERVLEICLETGRARRIHGPQGELTLWQLFQRTPRGTALRGTVDTANQALAALAGQMIEEIRFTPRIPGVYQLLIGTARAEVVLEIDQTGIWAKSVVAGGD